MTIPQSALLLFAFSVATDGSAQAQVSRIAPTTAPTETENSRHRFSFGYRAAFNIEARFQNVGSDSGANPGSPTGGVPHTYDDGFVLVDISGNEGGQTWNWGYENSSQIRGDQLVFSASNPGRLSGDVNNDPQHGFELTYAYQIGERSKYRWGIEMAFGYTDLAFRDRSAPDATVLAIDAYSLDGITPPLAPYAGTFAGPGPLISDTPARSQVSVASRLDASLFDLRLGPSLEIPLCKQASLKLSGGPVIAIVDSEFKYTQTAAILPATTLSDSARDSQTKVLAGGYLAGTLTARLTQSMGIYAGVQFQSLGDFSQRAGDKRASLSLGQTVFVSGGFSFAF